VGGVARRADGTVDHRQSGAVPKRRVPSGGRCIYAAQRPPIFRSAVDATDGVDLGLPLKQGTAPTGTALPAISLYFRILFAVGPPARAGLGKDPSDKILSFVRGFSYLRLSLKFAFANRTPIGISAGQHLAAMQERTLAATGLGTVG
jgi:hypothetical protein